MYSAMVVTTQRRVGVLPFEVSPEAVRAVVVVVVVPRGGWAPPELLQATGKNRTFFRITAP